MYYIFATLLFIISCVGSKKEIEEFDKLADTNQRLKDKLYIIEEGELIRQEIFRRTIIYNEYSIENNHVYLGKDSLNACALKEIVTNPCLVFCFSSNMCSPCIEKSINILIETTHNYTDNKRIIIAGDYPFRLRDNFYGKRMLTGIVLPVEKIEAPFFFILDSNLKIIDLHIFNKTNPDLTKIYLEEIHKKYNL